MLDYLLKQFLCVLEPVGLVWAAVGALAVCLWVRRQRRFACAAAGIFVFIFIIGGTPLPDCLVRSLELPYSGLDPRSLPDADAIVMLGGGSEPAQFEFHHVHLSPAADRIVAAGALLRMKKAPVLVLGGGRGRVGSRMLAEAEGVKDLLVSWYIPADAIIPLPFNADTHDEAVHTRALATAQGWHRILLVTSANHMHRAAAVFRKQGFEVIPAPCNFLAVGGSECHSFSLVPRYEGFAKVAVWLHECAGWWIYKHRGWL